MDSVLSDWVSHFSNTGKLKSYLRHYCMKWYMLIYFWLSPAIRAMVLMDMERYQNGLKLCCRTSKTRWEKSIKLQVCALLFTTVSMMRWTATDSMFGCAMYIPLFTLLGFLQKTSPFLRHRQTSKEYASRQLGRLVYVILINICSRCSSGKMWRDFHQNCWTCWLQAQTTKT